MNKLIIFVFLIEMVLCANLISGTTSFDATHQYPLFNRLSSSESQHNISSILKPKNLNADQTISIKHNGNGIFNGNKDHDRFLSGDSRLDSSRQTAINTDNFEGRILSNKNSILLKGYLPENINDDHCSTYKYVLDSEGIIQYDHSIPVLDQFTLCSWVKFTNHSGDHSIFTYSVDGEPREIQFWVSNSKGSSYLSLAVHGQTLYRLNYPLKLQQWHHTCTSWNGKTGEWQLWIKAYRVGRGFHNGLIGHIIKPYGGVVFSGGKSVNGQVPDGLHMEITLLQLYKVALSAGKANRDHKHHHVHLYNHDGLAITNEPPQIQPQTTPTPISSAQSSQPSNSSLVNGQILKTLNINLAGVQPETEQLISTQDLHVKEQPSQLTGDLNSTQEPQPLNTSQKQQQPQPQPKQPQQQQQNQQQQIQEQKQESELLKKPQLLAGSPIQPQQKQQQEELERLQQQQQELQQILIQQEQQMQQQQQQLYQRRPHSLLQSSLNYQFPQTQQQHQLLQLQHQRQHQQEQHQQHQQELIQQQLLQLHQQQRQLQQQQRQLQHLQQQLLQQQIAVDTKLINVHYSLTGQFCSHPSQLQSLQASQIQNLQPTRPEQSTFKFPTPTTFDNIRNRVNEQYINNDGISHKSHLLFKRNVPQNIFEFDRYAKYGVPAIQEYVSKTIDIDDVTNDQDREPAECEVQSVLQTCSSHDVQPFLDALIMSWQNVRIKTINAFKVCGQNGCGDFPTKNKCSNTFIN